jgi:RNA ligase (TIGR02306 family)
MERKLASVQRIRNIIPIEGADSIEIAVINSWKVVVKRGEFKEGDLCIYCEIDSFLPIREEFEFLRKSSYKKMPDGKEGFRLKTIKLRGQISQGLILPLSILNSKEFSEMQIGISKQPWGDQLQLGPYDDALLIEEGIDLTSILGIAKYEPPVPVNLAGKVKGMFPGFLRKTDEERIQNLTSEYDSIRSSNDNFFVTEKLDGSSATFYFKNGEFGVCSRNLDLLESSENTFWKVARELMIEEKLGILDRNYALQGELIGEGIQGNPYKVKGHTVKIFNVFDIDNQTYLELEEMENLLKSINVDSFKLEMVPIITRNYNLPKTIEEVLLEAEDKSSLCDNIDREGIVIRNADKSISFKAISNTFLLKNQ